MYNNRPETDEIEIDLLKIAQVLLSKAKFIIAITLLVALATFLFTYYLITPTYTSTAMMYVNNSSISVGSTSFSISSAELTAAQSLVDTYIVILKSRTTLEEIIEREDLEYDYEELYDMIESNSVNSTEIFDIDVTSTDPYEAERIANAITEILPERIASIVDGSDVRIVDFAVVPSERTSPSYTLNTVIGALVGFVLAAAIVILRYLFDDQIHEEGFLTQTYPDIPLLAVVPDMLAESKGHYYYSSGSSSGQNKQKQLGEKKQKAGAQKKTREELPARTQRPQASRPSQTTPSGKPQQPARRPDQAVRPGQNQKKN